jgi:hypothetical protein
MTQTPFSYVRVRERRDKICTRALRPYIDANIIGATVYDICKDIMAEMPATVVETALYDSIRVLAGTKLTQQVAADLAWRLAGNVEKLIDGQPVLKWAQQLGDEIVPVVVEGVRPFKRKNSPGFLFTCRVLAGSPCPMVITQFFSRGSCSAISRTLGFSAPWGAYPYSTALHFVNLLFFAHIDAARSREMPFFAKVSASSSMLKANRKLIEVRCRAKPCPDQFEHGCSFCWFGYDQCEFATHARTYETRPCSACNTEGFFDPKDTGDVCVRCRYLRNHVECAGNADT